MILFTKQTDAVLSFMALTGAVIFLYLFGIHGLLRHVPLGMDFEVFHKAAELFLGGGNPWVDLINTKGPFSYPPHATSLLAVYGYFSEPVSLFLHTILNVLSIGVIAYLANRWYLKISNLRSMTIAQGCGLALLIGNPFMAHSVHLGQLLLPATAALMVSWHFLQKGNIWVSGIFLAFATIKPQVSILYVVWLLLHLNYRVLMIGGAVSLVMLIPAAVTYGLIDSFYYWLTSLSGYSSSAANIPGSVHVVGLESFFAAVGVQGTSWVFKPLALVATVALFKYRENVDPVLTLNLLLVFALTFIYGHDTDYAAIIMVWSLLVFTTVRSGNYLHIGIVMLLVFGFMFPQRLLRTIDFAALHHTRTFLIPLCCVCLFLWQTHRRPMSY